MLTALLGATVLAGAGQPCQLYLKVYRCVGAGKPPWVTVLAWRAHRRRGKLWSVFTRSPDDPDWELDSNYQTNFNAVATTSWGCASG